MLFISPGFTAAAAASARFIKKNLACKLCTLLGLAIVTGVPSHAQETLNLPAAFARHFETPFVSISPNGKQLASTHGNAVDNRLVVLDADKLEPMPMKASLKNVESALWHDDNTLLVVGRDLMDVRQLYRVSLDADSVTQLTRYRQGLGWEAVDLTILPVAVRKTDEIYLWTSRYGDGGGLYRINVVSGQSTHVFSFNHPMDQAFPLGQGNYLNEEWNGDEYALVLHKDGVTKPERLFSGKTGDGVEMRLLALARDQKSVYVTAMKNGMRGLYQFDLATRELGPLLHGDARYDIDGAPMVLPQSGDLVGITYDRDLPAAHYVDKPIGAIMARLAQYKKQQFCTLEDASSDRTKLVVLCRSDTVPGEYFIFNTARNSFDGIYSKSEWLMDLELNPMRPISYQARDGLTIEGYLTVPKTPPAGKPLIVMPHGGPHVRDTWGYKPWAQYFASLGYAVLQPNYRMSTGYGQSFHAKGWRQVGYAIQDDIADGIAWAQAQGYGRDGNMCIVGASFGAYAALRAATTTPTLFKCVIAAAGFYDIQSLLAADAQRPFYGIMKQLYGDPKVDGARHRAASALAAVERLTAPVLVIHGERDPRVSVKEARALITRLAELKKTHEVLIRNDEGHSFHKNSSRRALFETMGSFLARHLPSPPPAP